jgi:hypothetical protein
MQNIVESLNDSILVVYLDMLFDLCLAVDLVGGSFITD